MNSKIILKCVFLICVELSLIATLKAQYVFPTFNDEPRWNVYQTFWLDGEMVQYTFSADTSMCGYTYSKYYNLFTRNEDQKVYIRNGSDCSDPEYLLYDFGLEIGQKIQITHDPAGLDYLEFRVDSIETVNYFGINRKQLTVAFDRNGGPVDDTFYNVMHWIEGIGSNVHPFYSFWELGDAGESTYTLSCFDSSGVQYFGSPYEGACEIILSVLPVNNSGIEIYPNPIESILYIDPGTDEKYFYSIRSMTKNVIMFDVCYGKVQIDFRHYASGIYFVEITNAGGKVIDTKKMIKL